MRCWCGYLSAPRCRLFAYGHGLMPLPSKSIVISCLIEIKNDFTFLVPVCLDCPGKDVVKWVLVLFCSIHTFIGECLFKFHYVYFCQYLLSVWFPGKNIPKVTYFLVEELDIKPQPITSYVGWWCIRSLTVSSWLCNNSFRFCLLTQLTCTLVAANTSRLTDVLIASCFSNQSRLC